MPNSLGLSKQEFRAATPTESNAAARAMTQRLGGMAHASGGGYIEYLRDSDKTFASKLRAATGPGADFSS